jgi:hypothetical protein
VFLLQVEEEEYTSRIIQQFSTGLLTLPEGATLRSYLADKLNCDPMRITKKFTGACCLGRRVYHLRDRPRATPAEIEMAKAEVDHLEQRFLLRVEHELSGLPLARRQEMPLAQTQSRLSALFPMRNHPPLSTVAPWLPSFGAPNMPSNTPLAIVMPGNCSMPGVQSSGFPVGTMPSGAGQWLLPNYTDGTIPQVQAA